MKYFTTHDIFLSVLLSVVCGFLYGGIYCAWENILIFVKKILSVIPISISLIAKNNEKSFFKRAFEYRKFKFSFIERTVFDTVFFTFFGVGFIILSYISQDGYIRLYLLALTLTFFFISYKFFGKIFVIVFDRILGIIFNTILFCISVMLFPFYKISNYIICCIKKIAEPIRLKLRIKRSNRLAESKLKKIYLLLE